MMMILKVVVIFFVTFYEKCDFREKSLIINDYKKNALYY